MGMMKAATKIAKILPAKNNFSQVTRRSMASCCTKSSPVGPNSELKQSNISKVVPQWPSFGNPCLDLYFAFEGQRRKRANSSHIYLKQLLPLAWSRNPLSTLKLICNLQDMSGGKDEPELFYTALLWLHHNHPKTLASNVEAIAGDRGFVVGCLHDFVEILYRILLPEAQARVSSGWRQNALAIANKAEERYNCDPDFRLLHDRVSDLFADYLKSDIDKLKQKKQCAQDYSSAIAYLPYRGYHASTRLCESVARKVYPREEEYQGLEEADYTSRVRRRLIKEVLTPAQKLSYNREDDDEDSEGRYKCKVKRYMEDVKAGRCEIKIDEANFLVHNIIEYVDDPDVGCVAQLHWETTVEDLSNKGKWKNCLAVCEVSERMSRIRKVSLGLGLLLSQLNEQEAWKGKVIPFPPNPHQLRLHLIQGNDLESKSVFLRGRGMGMDFNSWDGNWTATPLHMRNVLDLILQEAVNANLKAEHMVKKVIVFTYSTIDLSHWPATYQEIRSKFEEIGYGDVLPHIIFWNLCNNMDGSMVVVSSRQPGMTTFTGFSDNFIKLFLDNEGEVGPDHAMEAAISGEEYQNLVVVD